MKSNIVLVILTLLLSVEISFSQYNNDVFFDYIKAPGTLLHNPVNDIVQGYDGLIWFCSNDGLHRYDGYQTTTYRYQKDKVQSNLTNKINSAFIHSDSIIYLGTENAGLLRFNTTNLQFSEIPFEDNEIYTIKQVIADGNGVLWLNCGKQGLFSVSPEKKRVKKQLDLPINVISIDSTGSLLIATNYLIGKLVNNTFEEGIALHRVPANTITALKYINGNLWIGTSSQGVYISKGEELLQLDLHKSTVAPITDFLKDTSGNIWLTTRDGLFIYNKDEVRSFRKEHYVEKTLSNDICLTAMMDQTGMVWIGTATGISTYDQYKSQFKHYIHKPYESNSFTDNMIRGLYEDDQQNIWICTNDNYINILDKSRTNIDHIRISINSTADEVTAFSVYQIDKHNFLVGSSIGLLNYNSLTKNFSPNKHLTPEVLGNEHVRQIVGYKDNQVLCLANGKVFLLDLKKGYVASVTNLLVDKSPPIKGYKHDNFKIVHVTKDKQVWLGSYGIIAQLSDNFEKIKYFPLEKWGGHTVLFLQEHNGYVWIGTYDGGLFKLNPRTGDFRKYTTEDGLGNNVVYAAIPDGLGYLWISTNNGISQFNIATETFTNYNKEDGLQNQEFNRLAFLKTSTGEIVLGGVNGLNIVVPEKISMNPNLAKASLLELTILNEMDPETKKHPVINLLGQKEITLSHNNNFLQFRYFASHYAAPSKNRFYYQLENYDKNWINAGYQNTATYTGITPGKYIFKVKGVNPDGLENQEFASVIITIKAPFWEKWWFYALAVTSALALGFVFVKRKIEKDTKLQKHLENEIAKRTEELKRSKEELSQLNSKKDFIFSILSHDLRSPLTTLEGFLGVLINNYDFMDGEDVKKHAITIKNSVANSLDLIDNTLYWSLSQMGSITHTPTKMNLSDFAKTVYNLYQLTAERKGIDFQLDVVDNVTIMADENMIYIVIRNLVSNAIKFTGRSEKVTLKVYKSASHAYVSVIDEGAGIRPENLSTLFDQTHTHRSKGTSNEKGTGLGLVLCKRFSEVNRGELSVKSEYKKGSTFTVTFPFCKN